MTFLDDPRFPDLVSRGATGGPGYDVEIVRSASGFEQRNLGQRQQLGAWGFESAILQPSEIDSLLNFYHGVGAGLVGFRFKDWTDFSTTTANGGLCGLSGTVVVGGFALGYGVPTYRTAKQYGFPALYRLRYLRKLVAGSMTVYRNAAPVTVGAGAGQIAIDANDGKVTFVADSSSAVTGMAVGATTQVTLAAALAGIAIGGRLYLAGLTGADAALLNGLSHAVTNVAGSTYTLSTNTAGKTITPAGSGYKYPQPGETLTLAAQFDVPVRFDAPQMQVAWMTAAQFDWRQIRVQEIRVR